MPCASGTMNGEKVPASGGGTLPKRFTIELHDGHHCLSSRGLESEAELGDARTADSLKTEVAQGTALSAGTLRSPGMACCRNSLRFLCDKRISGIHRGLNCLGD
jgi:hypothetical protein